MTGRRRGDIMRRNGAEANVEVTALTLRRLAIEREIDFCRMGPGKAAAGPIRHLRDQLRDIDRQIDWHRNG